MALDVFIKWNITMILVLCKYKSVNSSVHIKEDLCAIRYLPEKLRLLTIGKIMNNN